MTDLACWFIVLVLLAVLLRTKRHDRSDRSDRSDRPDQSEESERSPATARCAQLFALCLAGGLALGAPDTCRVLRAVVPIPGWDVLLSDELRLLGLCLLAELGRTLRSPVRPRRPAAVALAAAVLAFSALLFTLAHGPGWVDGTFDRPPARAAMAGYDLVFTLCAGWSITCFLAALRTCAVGLEHGPLRIALRLYTAAAAVGLLWSTWTLNDLVAVLSTGRQGMQEDLTSAVLGGLCLALVLAGTAAVVWPRQCTRLRHWWQAWGAYRRLGPLWRALHTDLPNIAFGHAGRLRRTLPHDARFALYRRVIEIRDAHLALRPHFPPPLAAWRPTSGPRATPSAAMIEAVNLGVAIEALRHDYRFTHGPSTPQPPAQRLDGLEAEIAWLVDVADAFTHSPAVARVRHQVRRDLRARGGQGPPTG